MKNRGFTIAELMIALVIMAIIMITIGNVTTTMTRQTLQAQVKSQVAGETGIALDQMERDIGYATYLYPNAILGGLNAGNAFGVCGDWSSDMNGPAAGGRYDASSGITKSSYTIYCVDANQFGNLYRYNGLVASCNPFPTIANCGAVSSNGAADGPNLIVAGNGTTTGVSRGDCCEAPAAAYFSQTLESNGVEIHYIVGNSTPIAGAVKAGQYIPTYYKIDTKVQINRSYNNGGG
jgi:prepilin-type N-terminal cleavage/methylation domain-containing protein